MPDITVSLDSTEPLRVLEVEVTGDDTATLDRGDFTESGSYHYEATYVAPGGGTYDFEVTEAEDYAGNAATVGQTDSVTIAGTPGEGWRRLLLTVPHEAVTADTTGCLVTLDLSRLPADFWNRVGPGGNDIRITPQSSSTLLPLSVHAVDDRRDKGELTFLADLDSDTDTSFWLYYGGGASFAAVGDADGENAVWAGHVGAWPLTAKWAYETSGGTAVRSTLGSERPQFFRDTAQSGDLNATRGVAWDGTYYYVCEDTALRKYNAAFSLQASNTSPFTSLPTGADLLGGCCVVDGVLYVITQDASDTTYAVLARYATSDLSYQAHTDWSAAGYRLRGLCADERTRSLFAVPELEASGGGSGVFREYDLDTFAHRGNISRNSGFGGPAYRDLTLFNGHFYVTENTPGVRVFRRDGTYLGLAYSVASVDFGGLDRRNDGLAFMIDNGTNERIHQLDVGRAGRRGGLCSQRSVAGYIQRSAAGYQVTGNLTITCEVYLPDLTAEQTLVSWGAAGENEADNLLYLFTVLTTGAIRGFHENSTGTNNDVNSTTGAVTVPNLRSIALVRDTSANNYTFWVNGTKYGPVTTGYGADPTGGTSGLARFGIGRNFSDTDDARTLNGEIANVRVLNSAKTEAWVLYSQLCAYDNASAIEIGTPEDTSDPT